MEEELTPEETTRQELARAVALQYFMLHTLLNLLVTGVAEQNRLQTLEPAAAVTTQEHADTIVVDTLNTILDLITLKWKSIKEHNAMGREKFGADWEDIDTTPFTRAIDDLKAFMADRGAGYTIEEQDQEGVAADHEGSAAQQSPDV